MRLIVMPLLLALVAVGDDIAAEPSEVLEVRRVYEEVLAALARGDLSKRDRQFEYCEPYQDSRRSLYASSEGVVRLYARQAGSDDSAVTWKHYYDEQGRLRFVLITGGAVNGTQIEHRIWFASDGNRIREQQNLLDGPGYTFPYPWPDEAIAKDPERQFASPNSCKEVSAK